MASITQEERKALEQFKELIADVKREVHDDHDLVKWLRARRLRVNDADTMYRKSMGWRKANNIDSLLQNYDVPEVMDKYYPGGVCGLDKDGRPVRIDCFTRADMRGLKASISREDFIGYFVHSMEHMINRLKEESKRQNKVINQVTQILDMGGFGRKHMWIPGIEMVAAVTHTTDDHFPEILHRVYIVNGPRLFHWGFSFVKTFLAEDTRNKFIILGNNWKEELLKVIDASQLPVYFGGTKTDPDGDEFCKSLVCPGGEVPKEYYLSEIENENELVPLQVKRGHKHTEDFIVKIANSILKWHIKADKDFSFGVIYYDSDSEKGTEVYPVTQISCSKIAHTDDIICEKPGKYSLVFDNHGSWWYHRQIKYHVEIIDMDTETKRLEEATQLAD